MGEIRAVKNLLVAGSNERLMLADVFLPEQQADCPVILYIHGFNGFKDWGNFDLIASQFAQSGFVFVKFNLSHNGTTPDSPEDFVDLEAFANNNYSKELFDTTCMLNWITDSSHVFAHQIDTNRIALLGHSRGGGIAILQAASDSRVRALLTWASVSVCQTPFGNYKPAKLKEWKEQGAIHYHNQRTGQSMPLYYQLYEDYVSHAQAYDLTKAMQQLDIPNLICHGTNDTAVPLQSAIDLQTWKPDSIFFTVDSDHVFGRKHPWETTLLPKPTVDVVQASISFLQSVFNKNLYCK